MAAETGIASATVSLLSGFCKLQMTANNSPEYITITLGHATEKTPPPIVLLLLAYFLCVSVCALPLVLLMT
jgi:hypothetical protein